MIAAIGKAGDLVNAIEKINPDDLESPAALVGFLQTARGLQDVVLAIRQFGNDPARSQVAATLAEDNLSLLLASYLRRRHSTLFRAGCVLTLIDAVETRPPEPAIVQNGVTLRYPVIRDQFDFSAIQALISDPSARFKSFYFPNNLASGADAWLAASRMFYALGLLADELNLSWVLQHPGVNDPLPTDTTPIDGDFPDDTEDPGFVNDDGADVPIVALAPVSDGYFASCFPTFRVALLGNASGSNLGFEVKCSSSKHPGATPGFIVGVTGSFNDTETFGAWRLTAQATGQIPAFVLQPTGFGLVPSVVPVTGGSAQLKLEQVPAPGSGPALVFGSANGTRLEIGSVALEGDFFFDPNHIAAAASIKASNGALVLDPGDGDGFLSSVLPKEMRAAFDLAIAYSSETGLTFQGGVGLDVNIPLGISAAGVTISSVHLGLQAGPAGLNGEISLGAGVVMGPVQTSVDRIGLAFAVTFPDNGGNFGPADLAYGFKAPSGLGIAVDAGVVTGGGFLSFDPAKSEYSGAAELSIEGIGVSAFGLIQTQPEVSFLVLLAATFPVPIELGMGFGLAGVGGLAGINRTLDLDALETAVWKGTAKDILFPSSPIASAVAILSELDVLFPAARGRYVFGPTAKIVWGEPALITAQVGVVIEVPDPVRIALIGNATAQFPPLEPLVLLKVNFAGGIDFGASRFYFDASLAGSRIENYPLSGDLSVRSVWAEPKSFALAVGGFNPHFQPPAGFPSLSRVALDISDGPLHLHLAAYLAITTNTFQVGASVDLKASVCDCGVNGYFAFDALFIKNPFSFSVDMDASASISAAGETFASVHVSGTLSGPGPWHATGSASISLLFFSIGVSFDRTWGSPAPASLPAVDPWTGALQAALADPANWYGQLPAGVQPAVTFAAQQSGSVVYLDPAGDVVLDQTAAPLNQPIERFAENRLAAPVRFDVAGPAVNGTAVDAANWTLVNNEFAPSQFSEMSDQEKLSAESFVALAAGIAIDVGATTGNSVQAGLTYDLIVIDSTRAAGPRIPFLPALTAQLASASTGPSARAPWRRAGLGAFAPAPGVAPKAALAGRVFSIVSTANLAQQAPAVASTRYQAGLALAGFVQQHAAPAGSFQAVPQSEAT